MGFIGMARGIWRSSDIGHRTKRMVEIASTHYRLRTSNETPPTPPSHSARGKTWSIALPRTARPSGRRWVALGVGGQVLLKGLMWMTDSEFRRLRPPIIGTQAYP